MLRPNLQSSAMELVTQKYLTETPHEELGELYEPYGPIDAEVHPWVYVHERCGGATQMPSNVRDNYLADPCWYFLGTICSRCGGGVPDEQCYWVDTGENLAEYMKRLTRGKSRAYRFVRWSPLWLGMAFAVMIAFQEAQKGNPVTVLALVIWTAMSAVLAWLPARCIRLLLGRLGLI